MAAATLDEVDVELRNIISSLYLLIVQTHDYQGPDTQRIMTVEIRNLLQHLQNLYQTSQRVPDRIPVEIIEYVEASRNPDIYTREFVELVMRCNQQQKGRAEAYAQFRDILGSKIMAGIPDIKDDVKRVVEATGGHV